jgi:hypothetical protein
VNPANDTKPNAKALFCAGCGSADVTTPTLAGGVASCNVCGWKGAVEELAVFHFTHDLGSPEQVFQQFFLELRKLLSREFAQGIGQLLIKWGFLEQPTPKNLSTVQQHLGRYVGGIAKAIAESVVKTRAAIEKEKHESPPAQA